MSEKLGKGWEYEPAPVEYTLIKNYIPDFVKDEKHYIEVKGFFRTGDQAKYLAVRDTLISQGKTFIFVLSDPNKPVRRGAKLTMSEWCDKNKIPWYMVETIKQLKKDFK